jgi:transcription elongation GreA/GreB family factor
MRTEQCSDMAGCSKTIVRPGSTVRIREGETEEEWTIVPPFQSNVLQRRLSEMSALGFALVGHHVGDVVKVRDGSVLRTVTVVCVDGTSAGSGDATGSCGG